MDSNIGPDEAAEALGRVREGREQVADLAWIPGWYWWLVGALMVGLAAGVDARSRPAIAVGTSVFVVGLLAGTASVVVRGARRVQLRGDLVAPGGVLAILGLVAVVVGLSLTIAFVLRAAGLSHPATIGCAAGAIALGAGGPALNRRLRKIMLGSEPGRPQ